MLWFETTLVWGCAWCQCYPLSFDMHLPPIPACMLTRYWSQAHLCGVGKISAGKYKTVTFNKNSHYKQAKTTFKRLSRPKNCTFLELMSSKKIKFDIFDVSKVTCTSFRGCLIPWKKFRQWIFVFLHSSVLPNWMNLGSFGEIILAQNDKFSRNKLSQHW